VVIPTLGRPCLQHALNTLAAADGPLPRQVVLADDRRDTPEPLPVTIPAPLAGRTVVVTLEGRGPAAARNAGWRAAEPADWVAFLDRLGAWHGRAGLGPLDHGRPGLPAQCAAGRGRI
jgi:hypothetical protein